MLLLFRYGPATCINFILMFLFFLLLMTPNDFSYHKTKDGSLAELVRKRYQSFDSELGAQIAVKYSITPPPPPPFSPSFKCHLWLMHGCILHQAGKADFDMLEKKAFELGEPKVASAKQVIKLGVCRLFIITLSPIYYLIWP